MNLTHLKQMTHVEVVAQHVETLSESLRPSLAAILTAAGTVGNVAVWQEAVKGWASLIVVLISVPTALAMLIYWLFKVRREWLDANK